MNDIMTMWIGIFIIGAILMMVAIGIGKARQTSQRDKVESITLGMPEDEMLSIMGNDYNRSLLKNNRVKYEWRYSNGSSTGYYNRGYSARQYHGVRKVTIYCKNGVVEEVKPYNV